MSSEFKWTSTQQPWGLSHILRLDLPKYGHAFAWIREKPDEVTLEIRGFLGRLVIDPMPHRNGLSAKNYAEYVLAPYFK